MSRTNREGGEINMEMEKCPCGNEAPYVECCGPLLEGRRLAKTPEEMLRSRYTAFTRSDVDYIMRTVSPKRRTEYNREEMQDWAANSDWHQLEILRTQDGGAEDKVGQVEFIAHYTYGGEKKAHHERALFVKDGAEWFFEDGTMVLGKPVVRTEPKVGRNDPCTCGSGLKYKKCHGR